MNGIHRLLTWLACGVLFVAAASLFLLVKARKGHVAPTPSDTALSGTQDGGKLQRIPATVAEPELTAILGELFTRTGMTPEEAREQLTRLGVSQDDLEETGPSTGAVPRNPDRPQVRRNFRAEIERAIRTGLRWARIQDDYSRAGVEYAEEGESQAFAAILYNPEARDRQELYSKLMMTLQEMVRRNEFPGSRRRIEELISILHDRATRAEEELTLRTVVHESEVGTREDRQLDAFQAGVIQHLRSKGLFPELDALYRPGTTEAAVNYNTRDAYALLVERCGIFATLEGMGIRKLLQAGEGEIRAMVEKALLPTSSSDATT